MVIFSCKLIIQHLVLPISLRSFINVIPQPRGMDPLSGADNISTEYRLARLRAKLGNEHCQGRPLGTACQLADHLATI